jgi:hypothetical protein
MVECVPVIKGILYVEPIIFLLLAVSRHPDVEVLVEDCDILNLERLQYVKFLLPA